MSGAAIGSAVGAIVAIAKLIPERAKMIVGYQGEVIDDLRDRMEEMREDHSTEINSLKREVRTLRARVTELEGL